MEKLKSLVRLEESLAKLPSVGKKSAERMAYAMLEMEDDDLLEFSNAIKNLKNRIHTCPICGCLTEDDVCEICSNDLRDKTTLMVVSYSKDLLAFENAEGYNGLYHVLGGVISLSKNIGIENLRITELLDRVKDGQIKEVIIATNPTIEGETTAMYLSKLLNPFVEQVTRLAYGLQMGGNLDYTDSLTLSKAIEGRRKL